MEGNGIWIAFAIFGIPLSAAVLYSLFLRGETLGKVEGSFETMLGATHDITLVVKRDGARVALMHRVMMGAGSRWFSAVQAKALADAIQKAGWGDAPFSDTRAAGFGVSREPGGVGILIDGDQDINVYLPRDEARELEELLRTASRR
jgi:hypothetical protein